ncbi:hypothetical protein AVEN_268729-1, partial [Araneus ventricosus]
MEYVGLSQPRRRHQEILVCFKLSPQNPVLDADCPIRDAPIRDDSAKISTDGFSMSSPFHC